MSENTVTLERPRPNFDLAAKGLLKVADEQLLDTPVVLHPLDGTAPQTFTIHDALNKRSYDEQGNPIRTPVVDLQAEDGTLTELNVTELFSLGAFTDEQLEAFIESAEQDKRQDTAEHIGQTIGNQLITVPKHFLATANEAQSVPKAEPDYSNALSMKADELWAQPNNGGKPQDPQYIESY